jgi:hypothetical protein
VQNLMHNRVHNLSELISSAWFGICGRIYVKKQSGRRKTHTIADFS